MKLTKEQEAWLQALESGAYKQGRIRLHPEEDTYCCLGVACTISNIGVWGAVPYILTNFAYVIKGENDQTAKLPGALVERLHLRDDGGGFEQRMVIKGRHFGALYEMNDSGKFTFKEIAAWIRENPEVVFTNV